MTDLLAIAASGLRGYRAALEATGENVANANSDGFGRRDVLLRAQAPGAGYALAKPQNAGLGVDVAGLRRAHDAFLTGDARDSRAERARLETQQTWLAEIEAVLGAGEASVGTAIADFYNAAGGVADDPGSTVERALMLNAADQLAQRFNAGAAGFGDIGAAMQRDLGFQVSEVNTLTRQLARTNDRLRRTAELSGASAGLKDERDRLLEELSRFVQVSVREGARGQVEVRLGDGFGPQLVTGGTAARLAPANDGPGLTVRLAKGGADVAGFLAGGSLAGILAGARQLERSTAILDGLAGDIAATLNTAHMAGVDLAGASGEPLFALQTIAVTGSPANTGTVALSTDVADGAPLSASGYRLFYTGSTGQWLLERRDGTASVTGTGPLVLDGLTLSLSGTPADADNFLLDPLAGAAGIGLRLDDPGKVAAAAAFLAGPLLANAGSGRITVTPDASAALPVLPAYRIVFTTPGDFEVQDTAGTVLLAAQPYVPGASIAGAGFSFVLDGAPVQGDSFEIARSVNAAGDSRALRDLVATRAAPIGLASFEERWERETGRVATRLADARTGGEAAARAEAGAVAARETRSGVDLDTEAANLIRFQQAYQASAQVIATARDIFDTMLQLG